jgi:hypothetical protein
LEYLKSNLKKLGEVQIQKTEAGKKVTKGKSELPKQNSEAEQKKESEAFSFILLDEMSTKVELRNLISNGIDIQKPQEKVDPKTN